MSKFKNGDIINLALKAEEELEGTDEPLCDWHKRQETNVHLIELEYHFGLDRCDICNCWHDPFSECQSRYCLQNLQN